MKTRLFTLFSTLIAISLLFAACSSTASLPSAASTADLSQAAELAIGTLRLEDSAHALDQRESQPASHLMDSLPIPGEQRFQPPRRSWMGLSTRSRKT